ncbi:hypothetical protein [Dyadobacter beijingensis]|uniref:hypothetical protein n=1 Tax=Dyadobacter beijingensis TaxID=365489 RepID=UPI0004763E3C|nr:hypothetical protein [Dyadobacter beijingensis]
MEKIEQINYIKAPVSTVYEALTTQRGLGSIWTTDLTVAGEVGATSDQLARAHGILPMVQLQLGHVFAEFERLLRERKGPGSRQFLRERIVGYSNSQ